MPNGQNVRRRPEESDHPQDFELIQLLIEEAGTNQQKTGFESFQARFQSFLDQISSYLHAPGKQGFFPHFFLGSFSTLVDTEIATKLNIEKVYFNFDNAKTLKVAVIKKGEIKSPEDAADKVRLFVIAESGSTEKKFSYGELDKILGNTKVVRNNFVRLARDQGKLGVRLVEITKEKGEMTGMSVNVQSSTKELDNDTFTTHEFKEIKKGLWQNPESDIVQLSSSNANEVTQPLTTILEKIGTVHSQYQNSLSYATGAREAAHHGFIAGALMNFHYMHNLKVYLEQFAGRGYADIILVPRGKERALNSIPIIIEVKAGTGFRTTSYDALRQAKDYAKGFQPNTMRVLTVSDNVLCVGLNLDAAEGEKFSTYISPREDREIAPPTMQALLNAASDWDGQESTIADIAERIKQPLERIYHTFPGTPEKGGNYFSRFLLGQLLLANEFERVNLEKSVFLYNEYPLSSSTRSGAQSTERPVTTFMLTKGSQEQDKEVFIFHIKEGGRGEFSEKKIPIDLQAVSKVTEVYISLQKARELDFFYVKRISRYNSLGEYEQGREPFNGELKPIPYSDNFKEAFDDLLNSQHTDRPNYPELKNKYENLLKKAGEGILPFKTLIKEESDFQGALHGAFSYYSDLKLHEPLETRALVLTEFQMGRGKRIDMLVHGIKFADRDTNAKEYIPVALELKGPRKGKTVQALIDEADSQITRDSKEGGVAYKTLTDGTEVAFIGVVFNGEAQDSNSLIQTSENFEHVPVKHSSIFDIEQQRSKKKPNLDSCLSKGNRRKRDVNNCLFSKSDVDEFSKGKVNENNVDKIIIDSEKFLTYVKNSQDEGKNAQLIEFIGNKNIEGDYKYLVDKVIEDQGYERYVQNERIKSLSGDVSQHNGILTQNPRLKSRLINAAGGIQLIRGIHGAITSCKDGTATDCGLNIGGIAWSFASQPIETAMIKITPQLIKHSETIVGKVLAGNLGKNAKFVVRIAGARFGKTMARGTAGAIGGAFDIVDIAMSANNLIDCKNRESSDNPCEEKEIRDNIASISFSGTSFISGVALTAAGMPVVGIAVGFGLMVGCGIYSGVSNIIEYEKKYDTTHGENWSIFWRTILFQPMARDVQHLAARKNIVNSLTKEAWRALSNSPSNVFAYGVGLGKVRFENGNPTLRPDSAKILMNVTNANRNNLSRVIPDSIKNAEMICLPQITNQEYEKGIKSSVSTAVHRCDNAMVIADKRRAKNGTIVYDLKNVDKGAVVGSNEANNNFLIFYGNAEITGGNNVVNRFILTNRDFSGKIIGGRNSTNILDLSQFSDGDANVNIDYSFKPNVSGSLKVRVNSRVLIDDLVSNNTDPFKYNYLGRQKKVDKISCTGPFEHSKNDDRDVIIDSGGGLNNSNKDIIENCKKVIISPYTTVKGEKRNYTFYVNSGYKSTDLSSEIKVKGTGTIIFPEIDLLSQCDQIIYSRNNNTLSLKIKLGQSNQFTLDINNYVEKSSNKPNFVLIDKNGSNIVPKIEKSDSPTITINSFELHTGCSQECSFSNFSSVENRYKKVLNNKKGYKVLSVIRDEIHKKECTTPHMVFGSSGDDIINFDQGTIFARGGNGNDLYNIDNSIGSKEVNIDNKSDDKKLDIVLMPETPEDFSIQGCDLRLSYNNTNVRVKNYFQDPDHKHLIIMNNKGEAFIPEIQPISCSNSSLGNGKFAPFYHATQTRNVFLIPEDFQGDHVVIDSSLEDIERYRDRDDLLLIREKEVPFVIKVENFYANQSKWEDITCSLWNNNEISPYFGLSQNISEIANYQDKLKNDYENLFKEYIIDFTESRNITHNQKSEGVSVEQEEERIGIIVFENITPNRIKVSRNGTDLVFSDEESNNTVNIRNWNSAQSYRISTLEFDLELDPIMIYRLDRFSLSNITDIQTLIDKASENYQNKAKYDSKVEDNFKCLVSINGFESENKTYECLGFSSLQEQISFTENFCNLDQLIEFKEKGSNKTLPLLRKLQNDLFLRGYDQDTINQCSNLILAKENSSQVIDKISSMVDSIEKLTALHAITSASVSKPKSTLNLSNCLSNRGRRSTSEYGECLISWEDLDNFNEEAIEKRNINKVNVNSEKFIDYVKDITDQDKRYQLIDLAGQVKVTGKFKDVINKVAHSQKIMNHLNKVKRVSNILMHGMIAKNTLVDLLNGDYPEVAINLGFIAGSHGFAKFANTIANKGVGLVADGKVLLGRSLKAASPFLARGTSAFVVYDLINQIKEFKNGSEEALPGIIGDSIYLVVDATEIGIEVAEAFEVLEGVSSITGPIGAGIGAIVFIGTDIYMAVKRVDNIDRIIHLTGEEKFIEGLRAFIGMQPEQYIEELINEKQVNNQLVNQAIEFLKQHNDIQRYVFPTGKSVPDVCKPVCMPGRITGYTGVSGATQECKEECTTKIQEDLDSIALLSEKISNVTWSEAKPDNPNVGELFCLPAKECDSFMRISRGICYDALPNKEAVYFCGNAIGVAYTSNTGDNTLINLGKGQDFAMGFADSPNIFVVNNGKKEYHGGASNDRFVLSTMFFKNFLLCSFANYMGNKNPFVIEIGLYVKQLLRQFLLKSMNIVNKYFKSV